jgi:DNA-binding XRE family transcriptional regulator
MSETLPSTGKAQMRELLGDRIFGARRAAGMNRETLAGLVGIHPAHLGKIERGEVRTTNLETATRIARHLGLSLKDVAAIPELSDAERYALAHGLSVDTVTKLARNGRIEGAKKDARGVWRIDPAARRLPPTEDDRARWRAEYEHYDRAISQRRRRRSKKGANFV